MRESGTSYFLTGVRNSMCHFPLFIQFVKCEKSTTRTAVSERPDIMRATKKQKTFPRQPPPPQLHRTNHLTMPCVTDDDEEASSVLSFSEDESASLLSSWSESTESDAHDVGCPTANRCSPTSSSSSTSDEESSDDNSDDEGTHRLFTHRPPPI